MDITPQDNTQQPISDDQELAKALAGVIPDAPASDTPVITTTTPVETTEVPAMQFEETPAPTPAVTPVEETPVAQEEVAETPAIVSDSSDLDSIKKDALEELRPLIDKVDLPADEKFTIYLMLIRSTDDSTLIAPAHTAAQAIEDEDVRAKALLDIIKEIDYLSRGTETTE